MRAGWIDTQRGESISYRAKTGRRTLSHTATFLRDIVPKNRYRAGTKFRDAIMRRRIIGSMDRDRRYLRLIFFDVFLPGIFMISRDEYAQFFFLSWDSDSLTDLRPPCLFFYRILDSTVEHRKLNIDCYYPETKCLNS